mmetsp:Transcript_59170/g.183733  ORF Transcript_59170/g.183733 Transcript_59170/m.183733 type:complete len:255 (+) Transcript_59170:1610-2374(+)
MHGCRDALSSLRHEPARVQVAELYNAGRLLLLQLPDGLPQRVQALAQLGGVPPQALLRRDSVLPLHNLTTQCRKALLVALGALLELPCRRAQRGEAGDLLAKEAQLLAVVLLLVHDGLRAQLLIREAIVDLRLALVEPGDGQLELFHVRLLSVDRLAAPLQLLAHPSDGDVELQAAGLRGGPRLRDGRSELGELLLVRAEGGVHGRHGGAVAANTGDLLVQPLLERHPGRPLRFADALQLAVRGPGLVEAATGL